MKILHCVNAYAPDGPGGVESYALHLVAAQRARGDDVVVVSGTGRRAERVGVVETRHEGARVLRIARDDLYFDHFAKLWHPEVGALFDELLDAERPDVVHVHHWLRLTSDLVARAAARGAATVVSLHDFLVSCPRCFRVDRSGASCRKPIAVEACVGCVPRFGHESEAEVAAGIELHRRQFLAELDRAGAVVAISSFVAESLAAQSSFPRERVTVALLPYERHGRHAAPTPAPGEPLRFAYWGRISRPKGVALLIEAFRRALDSTGGRGELHLLGAFASEELERELRVAAAGAPITFHGPFTIDQLAAVRPHVGVFPSLCLETHGYVLDECFELGLPALLSDAGAPARRAGGAALVHAAGDVAALARDLAALLADPWRTAALAAARPPLPPTFADHAAELATLYDRARAAATRPFTAAFPPPSIDERLRFLQQQRESALERCCPAGGPS